MRRSFEIRKSEEMKKKRRIGLDKQYRRRRRRREEEEKRVSIKKGSAHLEPRAPFRGQTKKKGREKKRKRDTDSAWEFSVR